MFCVECGFELKEGYSFCPKCGREVKPERSDAELSVEEIANEIFWQRPVYIGPNAKKLSKRCGISRLDAVEIMEAKYKEYKAGKKQGLYPDTQYCRSCGSQNIEEFERPGIAVTSKADIFGGMYITSRSPSRKMLRCLTCGREWKPKKKK